MGLCIQMCLPHQTMLPGNAVDMTTAFKMHTYCITVIRIILTLECICNYTSASLSWKQGVIYTCDVNVIKVHMYKLCVVLWMLLTCINTPIHMFKLLVLQCAFCICIVNTATFLQYTIAITVAEEGGANLLKCRHFN